MGKANVLLGRFIRPINLPLYSVAYCQRILNEATVELVVAFKVEEESNGMKSLVNIREDGPDGWVWEPSEMDLYSMRVPGFNKSRAQRPIIIYKFVHVNEQEWAMMTPGQSEEFLASQIDLIGQPYMVEAEHTELFSTLTKVIKKAKVGA